MADPYIALGWLAMGRGPQPQRRPDQHPQLGSGRTLVVGDRLDSDVAAAERAGLEAALVLTGGTSVEEADSSKADAPRPVAVAESLSALVKG